MTETPRHLAPQNRIAADAQSAVSALILRFEIMCRTEALRLGVDARDLIDLATLRLDERRIERKLEPPTRRRSP